MNNPSSSKSEQSLMSFAHLDLDRIKRRKVGEVIFGEGKKITEIVQIMVRLYRLQGKALTTRVAPEIAVSVIEQLTLELSNDLNLSPQLSYNDQSRCLSLQSVAPTSTGRGEVLIISAGTSDGAVAAEAEDVLKFLGHSVARLNDVGVAGLHRILSHLERIQSAEVIIVCAGMEGALASVVAGLVDCPVIAVPTSIGYGANLGGITTLLAMLNSCAAGVVVVNIDNGFGAAYTAAQINRTRTLK